MALPLEQEIMEEIGLGQHYGWFNGSGSCEYIREQAAASVGDAIQRRHIAGEEIMAPDGSLVALGREVAKWGDEDRYVLTKTWQALSYIIAHHIHMFHCDEQERSRRTFELARHLRARFCPPGGVWAPGAMGDEANIGKAVRSAERRQAMRDVMMPQQRIDAGDEAKEELFGL